MKAKSNGFYFTFVDFLTLVVIGGIIISLNGGNAKGTLMLMIPFSLLVGFKGWTIYIK